ncbi:hypothetical protein OC844_001535 [Tilletia horrida]|nr:hypothetical protein OC844_001535 [Tilletia horrida]
MPKKKGNLRGALAAHSRRQEQKVREGAVAEAQKRKLESMKTGGGGGGGGNGKQETAKRRRLNEADKAGTSTSTTKAVAVDGAATAAAPKAKTRSSRKAFMPFSKDDAILLVGEGNFSFTLSLLQPPHSLSPKQVLATAYDGEQECYRKYPDAEKIVTQIRDLAKKSGRPDEIVVFGVDAGNLSASKAVTGAGQKGGAAQRRFSKIWFGFPHVGAGHKDETRNILANQLLLLRFLVSAAPLLSTGPLPAWVQASLSGKKRRNEESDDEEDAEEGGQGGGDVTDLDDDDDEHNNLYGPRHASMAVPKRAGSVLITLRNCVPYTQWDVPTLGKRTQAMLPIIQRSAPALPKGQRAPTPAELARSFPDPKKSYAVWRSARFEPATFPGYSHRRTVGFVEGLSTEGNEDLLRSGTGGTGECRTWELGLVSSSTSS